MTMSGKTVEKPILLSVIILMISFVLFSCGSPGDWAENTLGRDEAAALLYEADHLRHRARRALLRANPGGSNISYNENPYARRPVLVFLEVRRSKYDDRTRLEYHSVNKRLPAGIAAVAGNEVATFVIARSYAEAGQKTKSSMHGREVLDLFDYHDVTTLKLIDRKTGRYTKTSIRGKDDDSIAAFLASLPEAPPHPDRITDYFEERRESVELRRKRLNQGAGAVMQ